MTNQEKHKIFGQLLESNKDKLYRICLGYLYEKNLAEDCFQEVLINIWKSLDNFKNKSQISTYVYRITVNTTISFNKKEKRHKQITGSNEPDFNRISNETTELGEEKSEKLAMLRKAISELADQERLIISMVLDEISNKEIGEIMGISQNHIGVKIHRIKNSLSQKLNAT